MYVEGLFNMYYFCHIINKLDLQITLLFLETISSFENTFETKNQVVTASVTPSRKSKAKQ
jgi:hypothetical protein